MTDHATIESRTARFARRRAEVIDVATNQINLKGLSGLTLTAVARELGLHTSSVTYYFHFKDDLAAACLERSLSVLDERIKAAASEASIPARVQRMLEEAVEVHRGQHDPAAPRLAVLSDLAALDAERSAPLHAIYNDAFRRVVRFFEPHPGDEPSAGGFIAAHLLLANVHWLPAWLHQYHSGDFDRVASRLGDTLGAGLGPPGAWPLDLTPLEPGGEPEDSQVRFLHAATNLINQHGYKGASVEKIAAVLGRSVGSFYHHLEGKDELVLACFDRTFEIFERARRRAETGARPAAERLATMVSLLLGFQFAAESPLLRSLAYQALPPDLREEMMGRARAITLHFAGLIADGMAEGALRPGDPLIASHVVMAAVDAAADLRGWAAQRPVAEAVATYTRMLQAGILPAGAR